MKREAQVIIKTEVLFFDREGDETTPVAVVMLRPAQMIADADDSPLNILYGRVVMTGEAKAHPKFLQHVDLEVGALMKDMEPWFIELKAAIRAALVEAVTA